MLLEGSRRLITRASAAAIAGLCLLSTTASAQFSAQVLPPPSGFPAGTLTRAFALNASGQVLGEAIPPGGQGRVLVLWTDGIATVLPIPPGYYWDDSNTSLNFLNDAGVAASHVAITGSGSPSRPDARRVIVWNQGAPEIVDPPETGWTGRDFAGSACEDYYTFPSGLNASGQLLFTTGNADGSARCGRIWLDAGGAFTVLPDPVGGTPLCRLVFVPVPHGLNDSAHVLLQTGQVAINAISNCTGVPAPAGILSGAGFVPLTTTTPISLNNRDQILSWTNNGGTPFIHLVDGANTADLGQGGYPSLNDRGQVVFVSTAAGGFAPVMYQDGVTTSLVFPPNSGPGPGTGGGQPLLLNSLGQIVSWTFAPGFEQAVLLIPAASTLSVPAVTGSFGGTVTLSSTLTSLGQPLVGKTVTFVLNGVPAGVGVTDVLGNATLAGVSLGGLNAGVYSDALQVVFEGAAGYAPVSASAALMIAQAVPHIAWSNPADIVYGTPLGIAQLNASANVPGTFVYTPAPGTVLAVGTGQTLSVTFTPADGIDYTTAAATVHITVLLPPTPVVSLTVNGQHPNPAVVTTTGPMTLTLNIAASAYTAPVSWYWALIVNGHVVWITSTGTRTTPAPIIVTPPTAVTNAVLLNMTLPQGTTLTSVFFLVDGAGSLIAGDLIAATRP